MRESIGNALLFIIVITVLSVLTLLLVASFSYSRAFKAKNKIVNAIEKYKGFTDETEEEIRIDLRNMGYRLITRYNACRGEGTIKYGNVSGNYHYCVYEHETNRGNYYTVTTYMHFDLPIIGSSIAIPVHGESRIIYQAVGG